MENSSHWDIQLHRSDLDQVEREGERRGMKMRGEERKGKERKGREDEGGEFRR